MLFTKKQKVLCNSKVVLKNKKAGLHESVPSWIVGILVISISLYITFSTVNTSTKDLKETPPTLTDKFPAVFLQTFLMQEIEKEDKESINSQKDKLYIKDLIWLNTQTSKELIDKYRKKFILEMSQESKSGKNIFDYREDNDFVNKNNLDKNNLIVIEYDKESIPENLEEYIKSNNYFYFFKTQDNTYSIVYYEKSKHSNARLLKVKWNYLIKTKKQELDSLL